MAADWHCFCEFIVKVWCRSNKNKLKQLWSHLNPPSGWVSISLEKRSGWRSDAVTGKFSCVNTNLSWLKIWAAVQQDKRRSVCEVLQSVHIRLSKSSNISQLSSVKQSVVPSVGNQLATQVIFSAWAALLFLRSYSTGSCDHCKGQSPLIQTHWCCSKHSKPNKETINELFWGMKSCCRLQKLNYINIELRDH